MLGVSSPPSVRAQAARAGLVLRRRAVPLMSPSRSSEADRVIERLRQGDSLAAEQLFSRFSGQLCRLVQRKLGWRYRRKLDPEDVAQSVFKSFLRMQRSSDASFDTWDALWAYLSLIAIRKCGHRVDYLRAARRDVARERDATLRPRHLERSRTDLTALSRDPTPSHAAMLKEAVDRLLEPLEERDRAIAMLALQGYATTEISERVERSERTVQRVLCRLREQLEAAADAAE